MSRPDPTALMDGFPEAAEVLSALLAGLEVPGASIAVVLGDRGYLHAAGSRSIEAAAPVTATTAFNVASCSKAFGAATVAALVAEGRMAWDDPIRRYVPEFVLADDWAAANATLRDACGNRLGLANGGLLEFGLGEDLTTEELLANLAHVPFARPFRDGFAYVNGGHAAAGLAVSRVCGQPLIEVIEERLMQPLGMQHSSGGRRAGRRLTDVARGHGRVDGAIVEVETAFVDNSLPAGEMWICGRDAVQWLRLHLNGGEVDGRQVLPPAAVAELHRPVVALSREDLDASGMSFPGAPFAAYCLGWATTLAEGERVLQHSGSDFGFGAYTLLVPERGFGVAVYCNLSPGSARALAYTATAAILDWPRRDWLQFFGLTRRRRGAAETPASVASPSGVAVPPDRLQEYAGRYSHPALGLLDVQVAGGQLLGHVPRAHRLRFALLSDGVDRFRMKLLDPAWRSITEDAAITVTYDRSSSPGALALHLGDVPNVFHRTPA